MFHELGQSLVRELLDLGYEIHFHVHSHFVTRFTAILAVTVGITNLFALFVTSTGSESSSTSTGTGFRATRIAYGGAMVLSFGC